MSFTIVTALIDIGRERWDNMYKRKWNEYISWLECMALQINAPLYIYIEPSLESFIKSQRSVFKETIVKPISLNEYNLFSYKNKIQEIQNSDKYKNCGVESFCPEVCIPEYNIVVNNKVQFMYNVSVENPFNTDYFIWLDAGYGHGKISIPHNFTWNPSSYIERAKDDKIVINTLHDEMKSENPWEFFKAHQDFIDGGFFVATKQALIKLKYLYYQTIDETITDRLIDDDQFYMALTYAKNKDLFSVSNQKEWKNRSQIFE